MKRMPSWMLRPIPDSIKGKSVSAYLKEKGLNTVCENSRCPNMTECYSEGKASFLILGNVCTRNCLFCAVHKGLPKAVESTEAPALAEAVKKLGMHYVVITSVTRDDLIDGGASHYREVVTALRRLSPRTKIEVLVPDFMGSEKAIQTVVDSGVEVFAHNVEMAERFYPLIRSKSDYRRSLKVLSFAASLKRAKIKSGFMVGLGETQEEIFQLMEDIRVTGCDILSIGQYLCPKDSLLRAAEYVEPATFEAMKAKAHQMGFTAVASGPYVRSSYKAQELYEKGLA